MNPYKVLGVGHNASANEIKKKFLAKAKVLHPDSPSGSEEKFKELMEAYNVLRRSQPQTAFHSDASSVNYKNIVKRYERPTYQQQKRTSPENIQENLYDKKSNFHLHYFWPLGFLILLWGIGNFRDKSLAVDFQDDYVKNHSKVEFELYEKASHSNNKIKF